MQSLYDLFGQRDSVATSNKNTVTSFNHVQDAGVLKQKSNTFSVKKKALGDVGNKINAGNKNISSNPKQKTISCGQSEVKQSFKTLNELKVPKHNTSAKKIQNTPFQSTPSIKLAERVPQSLKSKINVYVEELDDITPKVESDDRISCVMDNFDENEGFFPDYDSFEEENDECEGPWLPKKLFHSKEEIFNLCSAVPFDIDEYCPLQDTRNVPFDIDEYCPLQDTRNVPFDIDSDIPQPVNELDTFDLPLPMDVPLLW